MWSYCGLHASTRHFVLKIFVDRSSYFFSSELLLSIIGSEIGGRSYISKEERCLCTSTEGVWKMSKMQSICSRLGMPTYLPWYFLEHIPTIIILFEYVGYHIALVHLQCGAILGMSMVDVCINMRMSALCRRNSWFKILNWCEESWVQDCRRTISFFVVGSSSTVLIWKQPYFPFKYFLGHTWPGGCGPSKWPIHRFRIS